MKLTSPLKRFWNLLKPFNAKIKKLYALALFNGLVNLSLPLGIQAIVNYIQTGVVSSAWFILIVFVLLGIGISGIIQVYQLKIVENIQQEIFTKSSFEFALRLPKIQNIKLDKIHAPELVNRFFDTLTIQKGLPKILIDFSLSSFQIIFGLLLLTIYNTSFIILAIGLVFILWLIVKITGPNGLQTSISESKYKYQLVYWLEEIARVNKTFKLYEKENYHLNKTDAITNEYINHREEHFQVLQKQYKLFIVFKIFVAATLLILGGLLVFNNRMDIGQFVAAEIIIIIIINSLDKVLRIIETIYDVLTALDKIGYVTDLPLDKNTGLSSINNNDVTISANNICFKFPNSKKNIFDNLSFNFVKGDVVSIEGENGKGKSTLLHLIAGIYTQNDGEILINNIPLQTYNKENLYKNIDICFATNQIFEGSLLDNITLDHSFPEDEITEVLTNIKLMNYLNTLPNGIYTKLDSGGNRIPRNIIQKISIARSLLKKPKILLLEDPLYYVDDKDKKDIIEYIIRKNKDAIVFIVADFYFWKEKANKTLKL